MYWHEMPPSRPQFSINLSVKGREALLFCGGPHPVQANRFAGAQGHVYTFIQTRSSSKDFDTAEFIINLKMSPHHDIMCAQTRQLLSREKEGLLSSVTFQKAYWFNNLFVGKCLAQRGVNHLFV